MKIFVTGIAGMIGMHTAIKLKDNGHTVSGIDSFNNYYDVNLKHDRATILRNKNVSVLNDNICNTNDWKNYLKNIDVVLHLAAYAGVRHSLDNPYEYIENNIIGTQRLIDACEKNNIKNVVYASTSCVQHGQSLPFKETDNPTHQTSPYGYTKRTNECQFLTSRIDRTIGLRFFTVYGPYGRPDMALFEFTRKIFDDEPITIFNHGDMKRDFTYVEDIVQGIELTIDKIYNDSIKYNEIYNLGRGQQVNLMDFVLEIEKNVGKEAKKNFSHMHPADLKETWADTTKIRQLGYDPKTSISEGVERFVDWYREYYKKNIDK